MKLLQVFLLLVVIALAYALGARPAKPLVPSTPDTTPPSPRQLEALRGPVQRRAGGAIAESGEPGQLRSRDHPRLAQLLKPSREWGSWKHDDARALGNVARICGRAPERLARLLLQTDRLDRVLSCYRRFTPFVSRSTTDLDTARHDLFDHKFRTGDFIDVALTESPSSSDFRTRFGIPDGSVVHSRGVATEAGTIRRVAWIAPAEFPTANLLEHEAAHLKQWRRSALRNLIAEAERSARN